MNILICGVGALGSNLVKYLVPDLKGEHQITILDKDVVEDRNIIAGTQWYCVGQLGYPKVEALQFNVFEWYQREIKIINSDFNQASIPEFDLLVDCFDNEEARRIAQNMYDIYKENVIHMGFSDQFTFEIEWAENYTVPTDITSGMDICEMPGAASFVNRVASLGSLVIQEWINNNKKLAVVGGKIHHSIISY